MTAAARRLLLPLFVLAFGVVLVGAAAWITFAERGPGAPPPSAIGGPFHLVAQDGRKVTEADFKGAPTLMFFGYTHCPDVCPTTLFEMSEILRKLGPDKKVHGLFVSVDPERDTPAIMQDYLSSFDKRIIGLSGDRPSTNAVLKEFRVYTKKVPGKDGDYSMDHSAIVYLMDKQMRFVNALDLSAPQRAIQEIERYL
jgi:protein SCO1/2